MRVDELMRSLVRRPVALLLIVVVAAAAAYVGYDRAANTYQSSATVLVVPPMTPEADGTMDNPFTRLDFSTAQLALVVATQLESDGVRERVVAAGGSGEYAADTLSGSNSATAQLTPQVSLTATAATAEDAAAAIGVLTNQASAQLAAVQSASNVPIATRAEIVVSSPPTTPTLVGNPQVRAAGVFGLAAGFVSLLLLVAAMPLLERRSHRRAAAADERSASMSDRKSKRESKRERKRESKQERTSQRASKRERKRASKQERTSERESKRERKQASKQERKSQRALKRERKRTSKVKPVPVPVPVPVPQAEPKPKSTSKSKSKSKSTSKSKSKSKSKSTSKPKRTSGPSPSADPRPTTAGGVPGVVFNAPTLTRPASDDSAWDEAEDDSAWDEAEDDSAWDDSAWDDPTPDDPTPVDPTPVDPAPEDPAPVTRDTVSAGWPGSLRRQEILRQMVRDDYRRSGSTVAWSRAEQRAAYLRAEERLNEKGLHRDHDGGTVIELGDHMSYRDHG